MFILIRTSRISIPSGDNEYTGTTGHIVMDADLHSCTADTHYTTKRKHTSHFGENYLHIRIQIPSVSSGKHIRMNRDFKAYR